MHMVHRELLPGEKRPIKVREATWRDSLPADAWPAGFAEGDAATRSDVFEVASAWRQGSASSRQFVTAALAWGYGPTGYGRWRTRRTLAADPDGIRLQYLLEPLMGETLPAGTLDSVYEAFFARPRLPWLGPAFFTKLIYFAGYRRGVGGVQPLILDRVVAGRLPAEVGVRSTTWQWTSAEWMRYITWAANQERDEPDEVEMALFSGETKTDTN